MNEENRIKGFSTLLLHNQLNETLLPLFLNYSTNGSYDINYTQEEDSIYIPYESRPETYIVPLVFVLVFTVGLLGNGTLIFIFIRNKSMRSIPNTYIISLAIGDFLVIVGTVPFISTIYTFDSWPYGTFICKLSEFLKEVSSGVTVLTLTLLSIDRYIAIVKPLHKLTGHSGKTVTLVLAVIVWIAAIAIAIPGAHFSFLWKVNLPPNHVIYVCYPFPEDMKPWYPQTMVLVKFLLLYAIPLGLIAIFYALMARHLFSASKDSFGTNHSHIQKRRRRTKVAKLVLVFVLLFAVCFFPSHVFMMWFYFHPNAIDNYSHFWHAWKILGYVLTFFNSCLNPIALYFISGVFRVQYRKYLFCCTTEPSKQNHLSMLKTLRSSSNRSTIRITQVSKI
ncbi:neuropeptide CCHamide-1 receptor-like [Stegodyphus dumicola]|uniref:neuropeptide CCHamide-1 receptor-like n=1 Tax=Stegodyphus dumicola TaxID=202533 RepID=UPI0015AFB618|nr:neuropeptide CCHamide-1 receptor-like [Stegodyphus dumicola]XP_035211681.1 neuropeptide CCHamide-1 receptor-like [Stegodyphus dumicola]XP_035211682.1 neuropeptide CCHamide-1 receptor-like [Stegodyphus dumicola]